MNIGKTICPALAKSNTFVEVHIVATQNLHIAYDLHGISTEKKRGKVPLLAGWKSQEYYESNEAKNKGTFNASPTSFKYVNKQQKLAFMAERAERWLKVDSS